jgi:hypothetical protein
VEAEIVHTADVSDDDSHEEWDSCLQNELPPHEWVMKVWSLTILPKHWVGGISWDEIPLKAVKTLVF